MPQFFKLSAFSAMALCAATHAYAANQGLTGATSNGDLDISMDISEEVKVSNLNDVPTGQYVPGGGNVVSTEDVCLHYNNAPTYSLTLGSTNGAGAGFVLDDGGGNTIPYNVAFDDQQGGGFVAMTDGVAQTFDGADTANNDDCATLGSDNGQVEVTIIDAGLLGVPNGTYSDVMTVTIEPNP